MYRALVGIDCAEVAVIGVVCIERLRNRAYVCANLKQFSPALAEPYLGSLSKRNVQQSNSSTLRFEASWSLKSGTTL